MEPIQLPNELVRLVSFWNCACSVFVNECAHSQHLPLYTNRKFGNLHRQASKMVEFLEQEGIFYVLESTSFPFAKGFLAANITFISAGRSFMV